MWYNDYIDENFTNYLNRYFTGIMLLKDKLEKISVSFELAEAFGNHACRFYIEIDFLDYDSLSTDDKSNTNIYFHNISHESGSKFVSFIYKGQRDHDADVEVVKSFIYHYQFAQNLFEGFIKNMLPANCPVDVASLDKEPFFNYILHFLRSEKYAEKEEQFSFEREYRKVTKRDFNFDRYHHADLINAAIKELANEEYVVTDEEVYSAGGGSIVDIRHFILKNDVPFSVGYYTDTIDRIEIDGVVLKEKMSDFIPSTYSSIKPKAILNLIKNREEDILEKRKKIEERGEALAIRLNDYVYVESTYYSNDKVIGIVKSVSLNYNNELEIYFNALNKDLSESRLPPKRARETEIVYTLPSEVFQEEKNNGTLRNKEQLMRLFKNKGNPNSAINSKKKKK